MKTSTFISLVIFQFLMISNCFAQLIADAGKDTAVCEDVTVLTIGGNPTASGGVPPYQFTWSGSYEYAGRIYTASFMLEDTTVANPVFKERAIPDSVVLYVNVRDANDSVAIDSMTVRRSSYISCLGECRHYIDLGDSVQLGHCVIGGIAPLQYAWEPSESLSDSTLENPWANPTAYVTYYTLEITDSIGCKTWSFCRVYTHTLNSKIKEDQSNILIYPNPSTHVIFVAFNSSSYLNTSFEILSLTGKTICIMEVCESILSIKTQDYSSGIYLYRWKSDNEVIETGKLVIE